MVRQLNVDDWSVGQIAEGLGISYLAAESLLARARRSFATELEASPPGTAHRTSRSKSRRIR
jgi:DNA-directed RNA polymerase specialized sigma24 family protein